MLGWVKSLIDDVIAGEFESPDLEFAWLSDPELDPAVQETILSGYTSKGILTINEARAALGHAPLTEPAADTPMALTGTGYVALPGGTIAAVSPAGSAPFSARKAAGYGMSSLLLEKAGEWDEDKHPRWPKGSSENQGGRFASSNGSAASSGNDEKNADRQQVAADGPYKPSGSVEVPIGGPDPLDPQKLNTMPTPQEQQDIADTLNTLEKGSPDEVAALEPHPL